MSPESQHFRIPLPCEGMTQVVSRFFWIFLSPVKFVLEFFEQNWQHHDDKRNAGKSQIDE